MSTSEHEQRTARSYSNLDAARAQEADRRKYSSQETRQRLSKEVEKRFNGRSPYDWQLDVGEALHLGLDTVLIARTGAGKTMPFVMPVLLGGKAIVISPLNALQDDQVSLL